FDQLDGLGAVLVSVRPGRSGADRRTGRSRILGGGHGWTPRRTQEVYQSLAHPPVLHFGNDKPRAPRLYLPSSRGQERGAENPPADSRDTRETAPPPPFGKVFAMLQDSFLRDSFGREFHYLRLSITDVCNFRCTYCLPDGYQGRP